MTVNGNTVSYTSDSTATAAEIVTGLSTAINALSISGLTVGGSTTLTLSMTAGQFLAVSVGQGPALSLLSLVQDHADPGVQTDLNAILTEDSNFYGVLNAFNSAAMVEQISLWCESQGTSGPKMLIAQMTDSICATTVPSGATDEMGVVKTANRFWTNLWFSPNTGDFLDAALAGSLLTTTPGSETWAMKSLGNVAASALTETQRSNILGKNGNLYELVAGVGNTTNGTAGSGQFIDVVRFRDWLSITMQGAVFLAMRALTPALKKTPFSDAGIATIEAKIRGVLQQGVDAGGLLSNPAPSVIVPLASSFTANQRATRILTGVSFTASLAGAIQGVTPLTGTLS
jgi:hypothetical protein